MVEPFLVPVDGWDDEGVVVFAGAGAAVEEDAERLPDDCVVLVPEEGVRVAEEDVLVPEDEIRDPEDAGADVRDELVADERPTAAGAVLVTVEAS